MREAELLEIRTAVAKLCESYPGEYWRELDRERRYPTEFVRALTAAGYLSCLIPEEYGGSGLGLTAAAAILEEVHAAPFAPLAWTSSRIAAVSARSRPSNAAWELR